MPGRSFLLLTIAILLPGCAVHQLRRSTTQIGIAVDDVVTQQVLDNLAKFKANADSMPHFSYPAGGQSDVTSRVGSSPAFDLTRWTLGGWRLPFESSSSDSEAFTVATVTDPRKLDLMRCVYQMVIDGQCRCSANGCPDCQKRLNNFYLGAETPPFVPELEPNGKPAFELLGAVIPDEDGVIVSLSDARPQRLYLDYNEYGDEIYRDASTHNLVLTDQASIEESLKNKTLRPLLKRDSLFDFSIRTGRITPACLTTGWVKCGGYGLKSNSHCCLQGEYCGTKIIVPDSYRAELTKLTCIILELAQYDPAIIVTPSEPAVQKLDVEMKLSGLPSISLFGSGTSAGQSVDQTGGSGPGVVPSMKLQSSPDFLRVQPRSPAPLINMIQEQRVRDQISR